MTTGTWVNPSAHFRNIPEELKRRDQWVLWKKEERLEKVTKVPYSALTRKLASSTNPNTWAPYDHVTDVFRRRAGMYDGIGFVLSESDPYVGVDLDHCIENEQIAEWALPILWTLNSYTEISPSGTGLRVFVKGTLPVGGRKKGPIEIYSEGRYLTMTGWIVRPQNNPTLAPAIEERTEELAGIHAEVFGVAEPEPVPQRTASAYIPADDAELLERMFSAVNGSRIQSLWFGSTAGHPSKSEADEALCSHLAFWCAGDTVRVDSLYRQSGLYAEKKWDARHAGDGRTYGQMTISKALQGQGQVLQSSSVVPRAGHYGGIPL